MAIKEYIRNVDRAILHTVFQTQIGVSTNVWGLVGETMNIKRTHTPHIHRAQARTSARTHTHSSPAACNI
jgi:hypothetical protein